RYRIIAEEVVRTLRGVREVKNELRVATVMRRNKELRESIVRALELDPATEGYDINVKAFQGVVTLEGRVRTWDERKLVDWIVQGVHGVRSIKNRLKDFDQQINPGELKRSNSEIAN